MPIYEYRCQDCGRITETLAGTGSKEIDLKCPDCHSTHLIRIPSAPAAFLFNQASAKGLTCCGREERCEKPPCAESGKCRKD